MWTLDNERPTYIQRFRGWYKSCENVHFRLSAYTLNEQSSLFTAEDRMLYIRAILISKTFLFSLFWEREREYPLLYPIPYFILFYSSFPPFIWERERWRRIEHKDSYYSTSHVWYDKGASCAYERIISVMRGQEIVRERKKCYILKRRGKRDRWNGDEKRRDREKWRRENKRELEEYIKGDNQENNGSRRTIDEQ